MPFSHKKSHLGSAAVTCLLVLVAALASTPALAAPSDDAPSADASAFGALPLVFEPNQGQSDEQVRFLGRSDTGLVFLTDEAIVLSLSDPEASRSVRESADDPAPPAGHLGAPPEARRHVVGLRPVGARSALVEGSDALDSRSSYFRLGRGEASRQVADVPHFASVVYRDLYQGVDLKVYGEGSTLRYDWIVEPGGDPRDIALAVDGADSLSIGADGDLLAGTPFGPLVQAAPFSYQVVGGEQVEVASAFRIDDAGLVRFEVASYDPAVPLVIDPSIAWSNCLGAWGGETYGVDSAVTSNGQAYMAGWTNAAAFPTPGGLQQQIGGGSDVFVAKLRIDGSLHRATFLHASNSDIARAVELDDARNVYVAGHFWDNGYPQGFVTKLNMFLDTLLDVHVFGGSDSDFVTDLAVDGAGNAVVVGQTESIDFCSQADAAGTCTLKSTPQGYDGFAVHINRYGTITWSSLFGWGQSDSIEAVAIDDVGSVYLGGSSGSLGSGEYKAWVKKLYSTGTGAFWHFNFNVPRNPNTSTLTFIRGLEVDDLRNVYVVGHTNAEALPVKNAVQPYYGGGWDTFVGQINNYGGSWIYLTYLGGPFHEISGDIAVGSNRQAYIVGRRDDLDADGDMFAARYSAGGASLVFYRKVGNGSGYDSATGVALDSSRNMYIAGTTESADLHGTCYVGALGLPLVAGALIKYLP